MKVDNIIQTAKKAYEDSIQSKEEYSLANSLKHAKTQAVIKPQEIKEAHEKLQLPAELTEKALEIAKLEYEAIEEKLNSLTLAETSKVVAENSDSYLEAVKKFTKAGGKKFYDIGSIVNIKYNQDVDSFKQGIKNLQDLGLDILIMNEEYLNNEEQSMYKTDTIISLALPSSQYSLYEEYMATNYKENMLKIHNHISRNNFFIPPFLTERESIPQLLNHIKNEKDVDRYNFAVFGYSTVDINTSAGYGRFEELRPEKESLKEAVQEALYYADYYNQKQDHVNGIMPTNLCIGEEVSKKLGIDPDEKTRKTITRDLEYLKLSPESKLDNKKRNRRKI